jgi:hypothetical protein
MVKKKQGYNARLDDALGSRHGKKKATFKARRDESEAMEKKYGKPKFSGNKASHQKKGSKEAKAWGAKMAKLRKKKK